jgi:tetratricopeptide (TPR) repeat protein/CHAT domain-containing protein
MAYDSNALVLEILKQDDGLRMSICEQREFASTLRHYSYCEVSFSQIDALCLEVTSLLSRVRRKEAPLDADALAGLKKAGQLLWEGLLTRPVRDTLKTTALRDLVLSLDEGLIHIPWELLYDGRDFLCLKYNVGRLVKTKTQTWPVSAAAAASRNSSRFRMLILANPTDDQKSANHEGIGIKNQFERMRKEMRIDFKSSRVDALYVKKNICDYDIVHFAGHGEYDASLPQKSGWVLADGKFSGGDILAAGETMALPSLVFSNACYSAQVSPRPLDADYQRKTYSLASAFLFAGVRHYLGTVCGIEDDAGLVFAKEFYAQLLHGRPLGECVRMGRLKLVREHGIFHISWAHFLLYGDPGFVLFGALPPTPAAGPAKGVFFPGRRALIKLSVLVLALGLCAGLYFWLPTLNPSSYFLLAKSRALFRRGLNRQAISICNAVISKDPLFLDVYPLLAESCRRLGKMDDALRYYFEYAFYSQKKQNNRSLADAYINIGWVYQLCGEYPKSADFYEKAIQLSRQSHDRLHEATALRKFAVWYMDKEDSDKALALLTKSSEINRQLRRRPGHLYNLACDYFDIGLVFANKDDFSGAREFYMKSQLIFQKLNLKHELSDCYFNLGEICLFEKQYQKAMDYYRKGLHLDEVYGDKPSLVSDYNMIGELYMEMGNLDGAEQFLLRALALSKQIDASSELAYTYYNLGALFRQKGDTEKAREYLALAYELYRDVDIPLSRKVKQELQMLESPS